MNAKDFGAFLARTRKACGLTQAGLPIGLQIVGPMFADALVLRAARAYERLRPILRPRLDG